MPKITASKLLVIKSGFQPISLGNNPSCSKLDLAGSKISSSVPVTS
jgi:hypothetical protein